MSTPFNTDKKLNVGITFFVSHQIHNILSNGTLQNVMFLYRLFEKSADIGKVYLVNGGDSEALPDGLLPSDFNPNIARFDAIKDEIDVLIDFHVQISPEQEQYIHARGGKVVQYKSGNVFVMEVENSIFGLDRPNSVLLDVKYDVTWTLPHHAKTNQYYLNTLYRSPVVIMPYIWDNKFIDHALTRVEGGQRYFYQPGQIGRPAKKRVAVLEPNFNIVKTCHYPVLVCEEAYRAAPDLFSSVYINNIDHMREQKNFIHFTHFLDITRNGIASYEGRFDTPYFMINHADVVVTHNWENQLNNLYFDLLYGGYPLVHNSEMLKDFGYYYEPFNTHDGAKALLQAMTEHDQNFDNYQQRNVSLFNALSPLNQRNIDAHVQGLLGLFQ